MIEIRAISKYAIVILKLIFTDGSKEGNRVAPAVVHRDNTKCVRLPDAASIFRAELYALLLAIDVVRCSEEKNFVIFSDSMSSL